MRGLLLVPAGLVAIVVGAYAAFDGNSGAAFSAALVGGVLVMAGVTKARELL